MRLLPYVQSTDPGRRIVFLQKLFSEVPELVGAKSAAYLLANAHWWGAGFVDEQLDRWLTSGSRSARQAYGEVVALAAIRPSTASPLRSVRWPVPIAYLGTLR